MNGIVILGLSIAAFSIYGAAYLLSLWHEDQRAGARGWPFTRVLAYVAVGACVSSNVLAAVTFLRLLDIPNFTAIRDALTPFTLGSLIFLDVAFTIIALYLRAVRARG